MGTIFKMNTSKCCGPQGWAGTRCQVCLEESVQRQGSRQPSVSCQGFFALALLLLVLLLGGLGV